MDALPIVFELGSKSVGQKRIMNQDGFTLAAKTQDRLQITTYGLK